MILQGNTWTLNAGSISSSANFTGTQPGDDLIVDGGGTLTGDLTLGSPDPNNPVRLVADSGTFDIDATLDVAGATVLQGAAQFGASAPQIATDAQIEVENGATLTVTGDVFMGPTIDIGAGGTVDLTGELGTIPGGVIRFDNAGGTLVLKSTAAPEIRDFHVGDTIKIEGTNSTTVTSISPDVYMVGSTIMELAGTYGGAPVATSDGQGNVLVTTPALTAVPLVFADSTTGISGAHSMTAAGSGGPSYLQFTYVDVSPDTISMTTPLQNVFIHGGSGEKAISVWAGQNVLDGGTGSAFLTGGVGTDTFFVDLRNSNTVWDTIRNFHAGDAVTVWGYTSGTDTMRIDASAGASGAQGATIRFLNNSGAVMGSVTFSGMTAAQVSALETSNGTQNAGPYAYFYNQGV